LSMLMQHLLILANRALALRPDYPRALKLKATAQQRLAAN